MLQVRAFDLRFQEYTVLNSFDIMTVLDQMMRGRMGLFLVFTTSRSRKGELPTTAVCSWVEPQPQHSPRHTHLHSNHSFLNLRRR
jgi:hypothetical protein